MVPIVLHVTFKKKGATLALPALPEAGQRYEREKRRRWKESKDSCDPHALRQGQNTSQHPLIPPIPAAVNDKPRSKNDPLFKNHHLSSYIALLQA